MLKLNTYILIVFLAFQFFGYSQERVLYKQIDSVNLFMDVYRPAKMDSTKKYPAMVFFFGGGWAKFNVDQFKPHAKYFSKRGMVCFLAGYRVSQVHSTTPTESLKDAKSAMRYIKWHADTFQIDSLKIVAAGGSAGGHLAAACALIKDYNGLNDNLSIDPAPSSLVLFNPVIDNGPGGYGYDRIGDAYKSFSPLHNITSGAPPTVFFLGTKDHLVPVETAKYYQKVMQNVGSRCELFLYEDQGHGFFNPSKSLEHYKKTVTATDVFLQSLGYLNKGPKIKIE